MSDLIKSWVLRVLGVVLEPEAWNSDSHGVILGRILERYSLIDEHQLAALEGVSAERSQVLESMRHAINGLGIDLTKSDFQEYLAGRGTMATKLYYELYLTLHDKNRVFFMASRKAKDTDGRFVATEAREQHQDPVVVDKFDNPLAEARTRQDHVVDWYKNKMEALMEKCKESRAAYVEYVKRREEEEASKRRVVLGSGKGRQNSAEEKLGEEFKEEDLSYEELLAEERAAQKTAPVRVDEEAARSILDDIKRRRHKVRQRTEQREVYHKQLTKDIWDKVMKSQSDHYRETFTERLLRQSLYERQMAVKLREVRREEEIMTQNRHDMMRKVAEAKERENVRSYMRTSKEEDEQKVRYYIERKRNLELHRRLYSERSRLKEEQTARMCREAVEDIVDISVLVSEYRERYGENVDAVKYQELSSLFVKQLPIFDVIDHVEDYMFGEADEVEDEETQRNYQIEVARQSFLDDITIGEYLGFSGFLRPTVGLMPPEKNRAITCGMNVLGFLVHRLLLLKYPRRPLPPPPEIPRPSVAVCVNGLHNMVYRVPLEKLLQSRRIRVIAMQDVINYCTQTFKEETTSEYLDKALVAETAEGLAKLRGVAKKKNKSFRSGSKSVTGFGSRVDDKGFVDKEVQTPRVFPCEELNLSEAGELGRIAHQVLNLGEALNDRLMADMFVEYLKSLKGCDGWVLLNYPQTMQQAVALEQRLTGVEVPVILDRRSVESILEDGDMDREIPDNSEAVDQLEPKRHSRIVPNPHPVAELNYNTYLTGFVWLESYEGDVLEEMYERFFNEETDHLKGFYAEQGCLTTLRYKTVDFATVKQLAKLVIGEVSGKPSVEVFADTLRYVQAEWDSLTEANFAVVKSARKSKKEGRRSATTKGSDDTTRRGSTKATKSGGRISKTSADRSKAKVHTFEDKETQVPSVTTLPPPSTDEPQVEPKPGEEGWDYMTLPLPPNLAEALATIWETMEDIFLASLRHMFFRTRVTLDSIVPYISYIHTNMVSLIERPHDMQRQLRDFQNEFNAFDDEMRDDDDFKAEMHHRVRDFRERLWTVCDERMRENLEEHSRVMAENWLMNVSYELTINVIEPLQLEIDRCYDSVRVVADYYTSMVTGTAYTQKTIERVVLPTIPLPADGDDHLLVGLDFQGDGFGESAFAKTIDEDMRWVAQVIGEYARFGQEALENLRKVFEPQPKGGKNKAKVLEPEPQVKERAEALLAEFQCVLDGIFTRAEVICEVIRYWFNVKQGELMSRTNRFYYSVQETIKTRYDKECATVDAICSLFLRAIEAETRIQPEILFDGCDFRIDIQSLMYEEDFADPTPPAVDPGDETYTVRQLERTVDVLQCVAPTAVLPQRAFTFLLQDFMVMDKAEDGMCAMVPRLWTQLHPTKTHLLTRRLFGDVGYVDWRDFVLYNLGVRFPTAEEVLHVRQCLLPLDPDRTECLQLHQYAELVYWFEDELPKDTLKEVRNLLLRLFTVDGDKFNYSAMLLAFCKGEDAISGLAKAVGLSVGKLLCYDDAERSRQATEVVSEEETVSAYDDGANWPSEEELPDEPQLCPEEVLFYLRATDFDAAEEDRRSVFVSSRLQSADVKTAVDYHVGFDVLMNVLSATLPWLSRLHAPRSQRLREKVAICFRANCAPDANRCCAYQLFNDADFRALLDGVQRFVVKDPVEMVHDILQDGDDTLRGSDGCQIAFF